MSALKTPVLIFFLSLALSACVVSKKGQLITGSLPQVSQSNARIYFYRSKNPFLAAIEPQFLVDGKSVGKVIMGHAIYRDAQPGNYEISISSDMENPISLSLSPGETRYIKAYGTTSVIRTYHAIKEVPEKEALSDLQGQKLSTPESKEK